MRTGKLAEAVRKRSVLRQLDKDRQRAGKFYGTDCIAFGTLAGLRTGSSAEASAQRVSRTEDGGQMVFAFPDRVPGSEEKPERMVTAVINSLLAAGAKPLQLLVQGILPQDYEEADLQKDMKKIAAAVNAESTAAEDRDFANGLADHSRILVSAGQLEVSSFVRKPHYIINGIGYRPQEELFFRPGQELVLTKWIALGGTAALAETFEEKLRGRYPLVLIDRAKEFEKLTSAASEARAITHFGAAPVYALGQGGIFGALWEMAEHAGVGLEVDLKKIPVKQETIEICEYFDINPYEFYSAGSLLVGTDRAEALIAELSLQGITAAVIGRVTDGKERLIRNGEDCRFLDRPGQDEWYRRIEGMQNSGGQL